VDKHLGETFIDRIERGFSTFSVLQSWFNDEQEDDEGGEGDEGKRYKKRLHDYTPCAKQTIAARPERAGSNSGCFSRACALLDDEGG
jgi:hypothetical protein